MKESYLLAGKKACLGLLSCREAASVRGDEKGGTAGRELGKVVKNSQSGKFAADPLLLKVPGRNGL